MKPVDIIVRPVQPDGAVIIVFWALIGGGPVVSMYLPGRCGRVWLCRNPPTSTRDWVAAIAAILGLLIGSFSMSSSTGFRNDGTPSGRWGPVTRCRQRRQNQLLTPRSRCSGCGHPGLAGSQHSTQPMFFVAGRSNLRLIRYHWIELLTGGLFFCCT
jgi:hypothetical protein